MVSEAIRTLTSFAGSLTSVGLFLSPCLTFKTICESRSVQNFTVEPYITALANCMIWLLYGVVSPDSVYVISVNGFGVVIHAIYVGIFIYHAAGDMRRRAIKTLVGMLIVVGLLIGLVFGLGNTARGFGIVGAMSAIGMYASPLFAIKRVIDTASTEFLPLGWAAASFVNAVLWTAYAFMPTNPYIAVPNIAGVLLGMLQLGVYCFYYNGGEAEAAA